MVDGLGMVPVPVLAAIGGCPPNIKHTEKTRNGRGKKNTPHDLWEARLCKAMPLKRLADEQGERAG